MGGPLMWWQPGTRMAYHYGRWALLVGAPLLVNGAVWMLFAAPQLAHLRAWRETERFSNLKPRLEALLVEGRQALTQHDQAPFTSDDPAAVMQTLQRLADAHRVEVKAISASGRGKEEQALGKAAIAGYVTMPLTLEVRGSFSKLAHWISAVEAQGGVQVETWTLASTTDEQDAPSQQRLAVTLTAWLRQT